MLLKLTRRTSGNESGFFRGLGEGGLGGVLGALSQSSLTPSCTPLNMSLILYSLSSFSCNSLRIFSFSSFSRRMRSSSSILFYSTSASASSFFFLARAIISRQPLVYSGMTSGCSGSTLPGWFSKIWSMFPVMSPCFSYDSSAPVFMITKLLVLGLLASSFSTSVASGSETFIAFCRAEPRAFLT